MDRDIESSINWVKEEVMFLREEAGHGRQRGKSSNNLPCGAGIFIGFLADLHTVSFLGPGVLHVLLLQTTSCVPSAS